MCRRHGRRDALSKEDREENHRLCSGLRFAGEEQSTDPDEHDRTDFAEHEATGFVAQSVRCCMTSERNRTRKESRTCMVCPATAALRKQWAGLKTIGRMDRKRVFNDGTIQA